MSSGVVRVMPHNPLAIYKKTFMPSGVSCWQPTQVNSNQGFHYLLKVGKDGIW